MKALSFYIERSSPIHTLNPLTKCACALIMVTAAFTTCSWFGNALLFALVLAPCSLVAGVGRTFAKSVFHLFAPFIIFLMVIYGLFFPGPAGESARFWDFSLSVSGLAEALEIGARVLIMLSSFTLLFLTTHPGRLMSAMVQQGAPWRLAYLVSSTLQVLPMMQARKDRIVEAQRSRGLSVAGGLFNRIKAVFPLIVPLVYSSIIDVEQRAMALEARGFSRSGPRTSLETIPDTSWERLLRIICLGSAALLIGRRLWLSWN